MRTRFDQAVTFVVVLTASAAVSSPLFSADVISSGPPPLIEEAPAPVSYGQFQTAQDVGDVGAAGATVFNAESGTYRVTGSGANMWGDVDALTALRPQRRCDTRDTNAPVSSKNKLQRVRARGRPKAVTNTKTRRRP